MIKKRVTFAFLVLSVAAVMSSGAIYAYFNDTETSTGNSFTAGTLDLTVNALNPWTTTQFNVDNLAPGDEGYVNLLLFNNGSTTGTLEGRIASITNAPGETYEPEKAFGTDLGELAANMMITVWIDPNGNGKIDGTETAAYNGYLSAATSGWNLGTLAGGATSKVSIGYQIPPSVGNVIQGDICTFSIEFILTQV